MTSFGLGIIYDHDDNNDDTTPVLSMFMLFLLLITRSYVLIRTWRTTKNLVPRFARAGDKEES
jgi:hypothetical protein